jgi:cytidylate kinase
MASSRPEPPPLVTISAAYGAGGSFVGPRLAQRLGVPFVDRAIPVAVAERLDIHPDEALAHEDVAPATFGRWLAQFAPAVQLFAGAVVAGATATSDDEQFRAATEEVLRQHAAGGQGAVILGRAAAIVLHDLPHALHVRLDGPEQARVRQAMRIRGIDRETAEEEMRATDTAREAYVRHWYKVDPRDPAFYHLVINGTALDLDGCVDMLEQALALRQG